MPLKIKWCLVYLFCVIYLYNSYLTFNLPLLSYFILILSPTHPYSVWWVIHVCVCVWERVCVCVCICVLIYLKGINALLSPLCVYVYVFFTPSNPYTHILHRLYTHVPKHPPPQPPLHPIPFKNKTKNLAKFVAFLAHVSYVKINRVLHFFILRGNKN